ncbi:hypothetical protein [Peribacillus faecalis]|uniref:hypothetical protein n=1 Tax=Peribacillus faecalis TaxID=2772559 RepID=UPI0019D6FF99|nr:hypothetical protein [Peribacillus faecalis]
MKQTLNYALIVEEIKANRNYQFREELDSELGKLYEAMQMNNDEAKNKCKQNLMRIRRELMDLNEDFGRK